MDKKLKNNNHNLIQVVDAKNLLLLWFGLGLFILITISVSIIPILLGGAVWSLLATPFALWSYLVWLCIKTQKDGYILDTEKDLFSFPGGKAADSVGDYFSKTWILQSIGCARSEIALSSITRIGWEDFGAEDIYVISIEGTSGTIRQVMSLGKRDQLYSMLQQTLGMGTAVVVN